MMNRIESVGVRLKLDTNSAKRASRGMGKHHNRGELEIGGMMQLLGFQQRLSG